MHPRRHPLFPTIAEAKENPSLAYSDHLPILVRVPLLDKGFTADLNIISLNTLGVSACSGLHAENAWETDKDAMARYQRIVNGLARGVELHDVGVIALQETVPHFIVPLLRNVLGEDWKIIEDERVGMVTCYNARKYTLNSDPDKTFLTEETRIRTLTLKDQENNEFVVHNIWGIYDPFSYRIEESIRALLNNHEGSAIIIGDFNSRIAPLDDIPRNITTGIVPAMFNENNGAGKNVQITDYPDGAFFHDSLSGTQQLRIQILDFNSGEIVVDKRSKDVLEPWLEYRMILCLDDQYAILELIDGKTIYQYEAELQNKLENKNIRMRVAANSFNEKAIAIRFPRNLRDKYSEIERYLGNEEGFQLGFIQDDKVGCSVPCIFAPFNKVEMLHAALQDADKLEDVIELDGGIEEPESTPGFFERNPLFRDILIGAAIGIAVAGVIVLSVYLAGGLPIVFGVVGTTMFALSESAAIYAGAGVIGASSMLLFSGLAAMAGFIYRKIFGGGVDDEPPIENNINDEHAPREDKKDSVQKQTKAPVWKPEKSATTPSLTQSGLGLKWELKDVSRKDDHNDGKKASVATTRSFGMKHDQI